MNKPAFPYHQRLTLQNFTAFSEASLEFVPGLNVLIGENGTGKTHIMKAMYAWRLARHLAEPNRDAKYEQVFTETYAAASVAELQRRKQKGAIASGRFGENDWKVALQNRSAVDNGIRPEPPRPVFIPAIEMMSHARNMNGILRDYADFDRTCFDFIAMLTAQQASDRPDAALEGISVLKSLIPGEVEWNEPEQRFYLVEKGKRLPFSLVAEGLRKVSSLYRLAQSGWLRPGGVLFWDEPEVNLNPKWMDEIVEALIALARGGVQIILATHSYVILKEIDLNLRNQNGRAEAAVPARYFSLNRERGSSRVMWADDFASLNPNSILDQYDQMLVEDWHLQDRANGREKSEK